MPCPFLKEGRARYCHTAPVQRLILDGPGAADGGRVPPLTTRSANWPLRMECSTTAARISRKSACSIAAFLR
jgi:hypothetical protein